MIENFELIGLNKVKDSEVYITATLKVSDKYGDFNAPIKGTNERKDALWKYCEGKWWEKKIAEVECDYITESGFPKNPLVISISEINQQ